ncbi:MAG: EutN/CcmL family microcompartment protein [Candidatus Marinimicrobia bacterium]|nr:EutN/CcmL family microcompartment protein [Candidatus Neomarinimicrobiota bacterium]
MILGKVCGTIHSTINHPFYDGKRLLLVDKLDAYQTPTGKYLICIDSVDAGAGETVLMLDEGNGARQIVGDSSAPLRSIIVGIIDEVNLS